MNPEQFDTLLNALTSRVSVLEHWRIQSDIAHARAEEQRRHFDTRFDDLKSQIGGLRDTLTWVTRLIIGALLLAIIAFLVRGGMAPTI